MEKPAGTVYKRKLKSETMGEGLGKVLCNRS